jgi:copper chaperone
MATTILSVPDISCEHCEKTIIGALRPVEGVQTVAVDIPGRTVRVDYDGSAVSVDRMKAILAGEDYPVAAAEPA